jgi:hypothetical protein
MPRFALALCRDAAHCGLDPPVLPSIDCCLPLDQRIARAWQGTGGGWGWGRRWDGSQKFSMPGLTRGAIAGVVADGSHASCQLRGLINPPSKMRRTFPKPCATASRGSRRPARARGAATTMAPASPPEPAKNLRPQRATNTQHHGPELPAAFLELPQRSADTLRNPRPHRFGSSP